MPAWGEVDGSPLRGRRNKKPAGSVQMQEILNKTEEHFPWFLNWKDVGVKVGKTAGDKTFKMLRAKRTRIGMVNFYFIFLGSDI